MRAGVVPARLAGVPHFGHSPPFSVGLEMSRPWRMHAEPAVTADPPSGFEVFGRQAEIGAPERDPRLRGEVVPAESVQQREIGETGGGHAGEVFDDTEAGMSGGHGESRGKSTVDTGERATQAAGDVADPPFALILVDRLANVPTQWSLPRPWCVLCHSQYWRVGLAPMVRQVQPDGFRAAGRRNPPRPAVHRSRVIKPVTRVLGSGSRVIEHRTREFRLQSRESRL